MSFSQQNALPKVTTHSVSQAVQTKQSVLGFTLNPSSGSVIEAKDGGVVLRFV